MVRPSPSTASPIRSARSTPRKGTRSVALIEAARGRRQAGRHSCGTSVPRRQQENGGRSLRHSSAGRGTARAVAASMARVTRIPRERPERPGPWPKSRRSPGSSTTAFPSRAPAGGDSAWMPSSASCRWSATSSAEGSGCSSSGARAPRPAARRRRAHAGKLGHRPGGGLDPGDRRRVRPVVQGEHAQPGPHAPPHRAARAADPRRVAGAAGARRGRRRRRRALGWLLVSLLAIAWSGSSDDSSGVHDRSWQNHRYRWWRTTLQRTTDRCSARTSSARSPMIESAPSRITSASGSRGGSRRFAGCDGPPSRPIAARWPRGARACAGPG